MSDKEKALEKLNEELSKPHSAALDQIHNWICEQDDEALFTGILAKDKNLITALSYVSGIASKQQMNRCAVLTDEEVYGHIAFYFKNEIKDVKPVTVQIQTSEVKKMPTITVPDMQPKPIDKPKPEPKKVKVSMEMSIFDFMDEPGPEKDPAEFDPSDGPMKEMSEMPDPVIVDDIEVDDDEPESDD